MSSSDLTSHNSEDDLSDYDEALDEVNKRINEAFDILKRETRKARKEKRSLDKVAKKLEHVHFSTMVQLNVGGHLFSTSVATLSRDPGSMLHAMFSGRFNTKPSEDGSYFIDRDGTHFRYILNYLRSGQLVLPEDKIVRKELLNEAEFYQVQGIIDELKGKPFKDTLILSSVQRQTLINWLKDTMTNASNDYVLLYRASRNGWNASNFHACCDNKGPTVTVVKSGNFIFGGYTDQQWESHASGVYREASASFLFSLVNHSGLPPTKMVLKDGKEGYAIYCHGGYGPTFGGGADLRFPSVPNSNSCYVNLNNTYECPVGQNATTFFTGAQTFTIQEMEVFGFEK